MPYCGSAPLPQWHLLWDWSSHLTHCFNAAETIVHLKIWQSLEINHIQHLQPKYSGSNMWTAIYRTNKNPPELLVRSAASDGPGSPTASPLPISAEHRSLAAVLPRVRNPKVLSLGPNVVITLENSLLSTLRRLSETSLVTSLRRCSDSCNPCGHLSAVTLRQWFSTGG